MALANEVIVVLVAAAYDMRYRRIPDWLILAGLVLGFALNGFLFQWPGLKMSLYGLGLAFLVYFPLYVLRGMGAGDVKLMMAVGALAGPAPWFFIMIFTALLGGIVAVVFLLARSRLRETFWNVGFLLHRLMQFKAPYAGKPELDVRSDKAVRLPHGALTALGTLVFLVAANFAVVGPLTLFVFLQILDALTTLVGFRLGVSEASPFVRMLVGFGPLTGLLAHGQKPRLWPGRRMYRHAEAPRDRPD